MNRRLQTQAIRVACTVLSVLIAPAIAQTGGGFDLAWNSIDGAV